MIVIVNAFSIIVYIMSDILEKDTYTPPVEPNNAGYDLPDERDWDYDDIIALDKTKKSEEWGSVDKLQTIKDFLTIYNQWADSQTINACWHYWLQHNINSARLFYGEVQTDPKLTRIPFQDERTDEQKFRGTSVQQNLNWFKNNGRIKWYGKAMSIQSAITAIDRWDFIYTGSNDWDWTAVRVEWVYKQRTDGKVVWHLFCIIGYDDRWFIGVNSYGQRNGFFYLPYELYNTLYTRYAVIYKDKAGLLLKYRDMITKDVKKDMFYSDAVIWAIENGITTETEEFRPDDLMTRGEAITWLYRLAKKNEWNN